MTNISVNALHENLIYIIEILNDVSVASLGYFKANV